MVVFCIVLNVFRVLYSVNIVCIVISRKLKKNESV